MNKFNGIREYGDPAYTRVRDPVYRRGSETEKDYEENMTF